MTYFKDLTPYEYLGKRENLEIPVLNIGWLGTDEFDKGETSPEFKANLFQFCLDSHLMLIMRGFHACPFCGLSWIEWGRYHPDYGPDAGLMGIGDGEIRVIGKSVIYAAPAFIYHYVVEHVYLPPKEFIDAVLTGPQLGSEEHQKLLVAYGKE